MKDTTISTFSYSGWDITCIDGPVGTTSELETLCTQLNITTPIPEMTFVKNSLLLHHKKTGYQLYFSTKDAINDWYTLQKEEYLARNEQVSPLAYDWTFSKGKYDGQSTNTLNKNAVDTTNENMDKNDKRNDIHVNNIENTHTFVTNAYIPIDLLLDRSAPILYFTSLPFYADDLHDKGIIEVNIKLRIMPKVFLILLRTFLRLDDGIVRMRDVRYWAYLDNNEENNDPKVFKATSVREALNKDLRAYLGRPIQQSREEILYTGEKMTKTEDSSSSESCHEMKNIYCALTSDEAYPALVTLAGDTLPEISLGEQIA